MQESVSLHGYSLDLTTDEKNELQEFLTHHELYKKWINVETDLGIYHTVLNNVTDLSVFTQHPKLVELLNNLAMNRLQLNNEFFQLIKSWDEKRRSKPTFGFNRFVKEN